MARYLVENYKIALFPYNDLIIYELGAGNGSFMLSVLDYIRDTDPEVYARTKYKIIEISTSLAALQKQRLERNADSRGHAEKVEIINQSILSWNTYVASPCFVIALEVIDNFGHDVVRYDRRNEQQLQGMVMIDVNGEMYQYYTPELDPVAKRYFRIRDAVGEQLDRRSPIPALLSSFRPRFFDRRDPLSEPEYIPTRLMHFFDILQRYFPGHRLLLSDFHFLPDAVEGINAPVVQPRYRRTPVSVSPPLVSLSQPRKQKSSPTKIYFFKAVLYPVTRLAD